MPSSIRCIFTTIQLLIFTGTLSHAQTSHYADSTKWVIDGQLAPYNNLQPGDTIKLLPGVRPFIIFKNIIGTEKDPIVIQNDSGVTEINSDHYFGISIRQSKHIKISGAGDSQTEYGIRIFNRKGSGLSIGDFSSFFEVEHIEVGYSEFSGIIAKTEPFCGFDRSSFLQENTIIHDCYVHHTGTEGLYIGSSFYTGQTLQCNGSPVIVYPPLLKNVEVYNNRIEYTGWDGIQVSSAINTRIHHNRIAYDSQEKASFQMTGIIVGGGCTGEIYSNDIRDGEGVGIFSNALGDIYIFNNKIIRPGKSETTTGAKYGMYIDESSAISGMNFHIYNNLILHARSEGIRFICTGGPLNSIFNNIIIQEASTFNNNTPVYINCIGTQAKISNNFLSTDIHSARFQNVTNDNYSLEQGSVLIDAGQLLPFNNCPYDILGNQRMQGNRIDIGPIESSFERNTDPTDGSTDIVYPNPGIKSGKSTIIFENPIEGWVEFRLIDFSGQIIKELGRNFYSTGTQFLVVNNQELQTGINYIQIVKRQHVSLIKLSIADD